jgi:hypothetical protein
MPNIRRFSDGLDLYHDVYLLRRKIARSVSIPPDIFVVAVNNELFEKDGEYASFSPSDSKVWLTLPEDEYDVERVSFILYHEVFHYICHNYEYVWMALEHRLNFLERLLCWWYGVWFWGTNYKPSYTEEAIADIFAYHMAGTFAHHKLIGDGVLFLAMKTAMPKLRPVFEALEEGFLAD